MDDIVGDLKTGTNITAIITITPPTRRPWCPRLVTVIRPGQRTPSVTTTVVIITIITDITFIIAEVTMRASPYIDPPRR